MSIFENKLDTRERLSLSWVIVMFYMLTIDVLSIFIPGSQDQAVEFAGDIGLEKIMLVSGLFMAIEISMIFLSRVLKYKANRWTNIIVGLLTIVFIIGGGSSYPHYLLIGAFEIVALLYIIFTAWKWSEKSS